MVGPLQSSERGLAPRSPAVRTGVSLETAGDPLEGAGRCLFSLPTSVPWTARGGLGRFRLLSQLRPSRVLPWCLSSEFTHGDIKAFLLYSATAQMSPWCPALLDFISCQLPPFPILPSRRTSKSSGLWDPALSLLSHVQESTLASPATFPSLGVRASLSMDSPLPSLGIHPSPHFVFQTAFLGDQLLAFLSTIAPAAAGVS